MCMSLWPSCALAACKELPRRCEDLAQEIYAFFKSSSKRQCQFPEFSEIFSLLRNCKSGKTKYITKCSQATMKLNWLTRTGERGDVFLQLWITCLVV